MRGELVGPGPAESPRQGGWPPLGAIEKAGGIDTRRPAQQPPRSAHEDRSW